MMINHANGFRIFNTIAFVVFCTALGHAAATSMTALLCGINAFEISAVLADPRNSADGSVIMLSGLFYTVFGFLIIPGVYLSLVDKRTSVRIFGAKNRIGIRSLVLSTAAIFTILPLVSVLIKLNQNIEFPTSLAGIENYLKAAEQRAWQSTMFLLTFTKFTDLMVAIFIIAIIPGIVEELFFRGIVQAELQRIFKSKHHAVLIAAFLFSAFHFQFYGFLPRLVLGVLLGYIFLNTDNIWHACVAHVTNNLISVVGGYIFGPQFFDSNTPSIMSYVLILPSIALTVFIVLSLRSTEVTKSHELGNGTY